MHWLYYASFGLMFTMGAVVFVLLMRAKQRRAWIWAVVALLGAAGLVALATGTYRPGWRRSSLAVVFTLIAVDHLAQYFASRRAGSPRNVQLLLAALWVILSVGVTF